MLLYTSPPEGLAWLEAGDEDWARYYTVVVGTAAERGEDDGPADDSTAS